MGEADQMFAASPAPRGGVGGALGLVPLERELKSRVDCVNADLGLINTLESRFYKQQE